MILRFSLDYRLILESPIPLGADKFCMEPTTEKDIVSPKIIGYSPEVVKMHTLALTGALTPILGIVPSIRALIKARRAKRELFLSNGSLDGHSLYKKAVFLGWLGIILFAINIAIAIALVWLIQNASSLLSEPVFQQFLQATSNSEVLNNVPANIDLEELGLSADDLERLREYLPEGIDINNLSVADILRIAKTYGIIE